MEGSTFHEELHALMDEFVAKVYEYSKRFPKDERYGLTSQLRRAALSIILNYIEGYARHRPAVLKNFLEISYGSLKEAKYLVYFAQRQEYLLKTQYEELTELSEKIGRMLWGTIVKIKA